MREFVLLSHVNASGVCEHTESKFELGQCVYKIYCALLCLTGVESFFCTGLCAALGGHPVVSSIHLASSANVRALWHCDV